ncbi:unnamed protein product, partial [Mesorhabditis belari]|uniref:MIF4G domain-containing protein n=1 Tax=Mesorhabditis belari TaxID=2138241 RepID=A0AAF3FF32_9BILA
MPEKLEKNGTRSKKQKSSFSSQFILGAAMDDDQLRTLFSSLTVLAQQGPIPVQAYSMVVRNTSPETLAEQLHQRWLADSKFAPIAADIILHIFNLDRGDFGLASCCLALLLNDYRNRLEVRNKSKLMFRNSVRALFGLYPVYMKMDECVAKSFIKPMFNCLDTLVDNNPDREDAKTMGLLLSENGRTLHQLNQYLVDRLIVKVRDQMCSDEPFMNSEIRRIFLHVMDLWAFGWNELAIPDCLLIEYDAPPQKAQLITRKQTIPIVHAPRKGILKERKDDIQKVEFGSKESIV